MVDKDRRGAQAEQLLSDDLLNETLDKLEEDYVALWKSSTSIEVREDAHRYVQVIEKFRGHLRSVATTGDLSRQEAKDLTGKKGFF